MTEANKAKIIMMKNKGMRPVDIERETGIPRETVKTFCKRHYAPIVLPEAQDYMTLPSGIFASLSRAFLRITARV